MYQAYWGLSQSPFAPAATRKLVDQHPLCGEALARLDFLVEHRSRFGLLVGPAGSGKSLVLGEFTRRQQSAGAAATLVGATGLTGRELLLEIATEWGCNPSLSADTGTLWRLATDRLAELRMEQVPAVLALDDLDAASGDALTLVERLLQVPEVELTVIAAARDESVSELGKRLLDLAELRIELALWTADDTRDYLQASLAAVGRVEPAFAERAVERLFQLSGGAPRRVGQLAQLALVAGAGQNLTQIDEQTVLAVHEELSTAR
jgi:type II secretory pathway predicted ATPase ExeA